VAGESEGYFVTKWAGRVAPKAEKNFDGETQSTDTAWKTYAYIGG